MNRAHFHIIGKIFPLFIFTLLVVSFACAQQAAPAPEAKVIEKPEAPTIKAAASWQQEWEALIKEAQKEGRLSIYSGMERDTILALRENFQEKYGIDMEIVTAKSTQLNAKLFMERQVGLYIPDLYIEGPNAPILEYKPRGILQPLDKVLFRPDVLDEKVWWKAYGPYFDKDHYLAAGTRTVSAPVIINRKMVRPEELTSYNDLLDPKWKGKIVLADPTVGGAGQSAMADTLIIMGEDYIRKLSDQAAVITSDNRLVVDWVAREKYPIGFGPSDSLVIEFIREGVPVDMIPFKEGHGAGASGVVVLFDPHPNPNAARLFINWFLTREAQEIYSVASGKMSRRIDVSSDHLLPVQRMKEGVKYILSDEEYYLRRPQYLEIIKKYYSNR